MIHVIGNINRFDRVFDSFYPIGKFRVPRDFQPNLEQDFISVKFGDTFKRFEAISLENTSRLRPIRRAIRLLSGEISINS